MDKDEIRDTILETFAESLEAQLRAVNRLRKPAEAPKPEHKRISQVDMVEDILHRADGPLHIEKIIDEVERIHRLRLNRDSIVSALAKKIAAGDRFVRTDRNTFGLLGRDQPC